MVTASQRSSKPGAQPAQVEHQSRLASQPARGHSRPESQLVRASASQPASQPASQRHSQPASQPARATTDQSQESQPARGPIGQSHSLASQRASEPASQASQRASQTASQPVSVTDSGPQPTRATASQVRAGWGRSAPRVPLARVAVSTGQSRQVSEPASQRGSQPATQPAL